jgi:hypothetical protein
VDGGEASVVTNALQRPQGMVVRAGPIRSMMELIFGRRLCLCVFYLFLLKSGTHRCPNGDPGMTFDRGSACVYRRLKWGRKIVRRPQRVQSDCPTTGDRGAVLTSSGE